MIRDPLTSVIVRTYIPTHVIAKGTLRAFAEHIARAYGYEVEK